MVRRKPPRERLIDDSAFLLQRVKEREPKPDAMFRSKEHLAWIRTLRCDRCGYWHAIEAAHLRLGTNTAKGEKPHDYFAWPGCHTCHQGRQHQVGEPAFWQRQHRIADPNRYVLEHYGMKSPCPKTRAAATEEHRRRYGDG